MSSRVQIHRGIDRVEPKSYLHRGTFENRRYLLATRSMSVIAMFQQLSWVRTMTILVTIAIVIAGLTAWGLITSRKERGIDGRHLAAFVGFSVALVAAAATTLGLIVGATHTHPSPAASGFLFIAWSIATVSILVTVVAGLFSRGVQRIALVSCSVVLFLIYLLNAVGHFGD